MQGDLDLAEGGSMLDQWRELYIYNSTWRRTLLPVLNESDIRGCSERL